MTNATHKNIKSGAMVNYISNRNAMVQILESGKRRQVEAGRFERDYEVLPPGPATGPSEATHGGDANTGKPSIALQAPDYGPRRMNEQARTAQRLIVRGSRRNKLTADDRDEMAKVGALSYCYGCGSNNDLQVSHAPAGVLGHGGSLKGHPVLLARLCVDCHSTIDQHKRSDWLETWLIAFARTQAAVYDARQAA